eukprot:SAG11_NODE_1986_length_3962_cov_4.050220_3_plen_197_part_00
MRQNTFVRWGSCAADTRKVFFQNLAELNREAIDLMLLHAPTSTGGGQQVYPGFGHSPPCDCTSAVACGAMQEQWAVLEEMYVAKKARAIGVSNYCVKCLDCLEKTQKVAPHVNQIRIRHAGMDVLIPARANGLVSECLRRDIAPQAYSPLGGGSLKVLSQPQLRMIGEKHNVSTAQVATPVYGDGSAQGAQYCLAV